MTEKTHVCHGSWFSCQDWILESYFSVLCGLLCRAYSFMFDAAILLGNDALESFYFGGTVVHITMNNGNNKDYETMVGNLIKEVFGISFTPWFKLKLWDNRYESYAVIKNDRMLANVFIYKTEITVYGKPFYALQFGGVATRKDERSKGLSRLLMEHIYAKYTDTPAFLGANPSVTNFYPRFDFRPVQTYQPYIEVTMHNENSNAVKLSPDDITVIEAIHRRKMHSNTLDSLNTQPIQIFNLLLAYSDAIYYLPNCAAIVVARQKDDALFIADVIAETPVLFNTLQKELPFTEVKRVKFGFCPDWLDINPEWTPVDMVKEPYFIRGEWNLPAKFRFPIISET